MQEVPQQEGVYSPVGSAAWARLARQLQGCFLQVCVYRLRAAAIAPVAAHSDARFMHSAWMAKLHACCMQSPQQFRLHDEQPFKWCRLGGDERGSSAFCYLCKKTVYMRTWPTSIYSMHVCTVVYCVCAYIITTRSVT